MTTNFLHSLIARHQENNIATGTVQLVQPRPKARFEELHESSSIAGNELIHYSGREPAPVFVEEQNFPQPHPSLVAKQPAFPPLHSIEPPLLQRKSGYYAAPVGLPEQITQLPRPAFFETASAPNHIIEQPILQRKQAANGLTAESVQRNSLPQQIPFSEFNASFPPLQHTLQRLNMPPPSAPSPVAESSSGQQQEFLLQQPSSARESSESRSAERQIAAHPFSADNLEHRIQQIAQRLNVQSVSKEYIVPPHIQEEFSEQSNAADSKGFDNKPAQELPASMETRKGQLTLAGELNQRIQEILRHSTMQKQDGDVKPLAVVAPAAQVSFFQPQTGRAEKQSSPPPPSAPESGLLQLPSWLNEMRTELHRRWQDSSPPASPAAEPVINVTIGRVEVRAMQTTAHSGPKARPQPSGVMSLDEYLKQRESRG